MIGLAGPASIALGLLVTTARADLEFNYTLNIPNGLVSFGLDHNATNNQGWEAHPRNTPARGAYYTNSGSNDSIMSVNMAGTALYVYGKFDPDEGTPVVALNEGDSFKMDSDPTSGQETAKFANLKRRPWGMTLRPQVIASNGTRAPAKESSWRIDSAMMTTYLATDAQSWDEIHIETDSFVKNGGLNPRFDWHPETYTSSGRKTQGQGAWAMAKSDNGDNVANATFTSDQSTYAVIPIPDNTSFIVINGSMGLKTGLIYATFSPDFTGHPTTAAGFNPDNTNGAAMAVTNWIRPGWPENGYLSNRQLFAMPVDPTLRMNMTLTCQAGGGNHSWVGLETIAFYRRHIITDSTNNNGTGSGTSIESAESAESTPDAGSSQADKAGSAKAAGVPSGTIAGITTGCVIGLILLGVGIWLVVRQCRARERRHRYTRAADAAYSSTSSFGASGDTGSVGFISHPLPQSPQALGIVPYTQAGSGNPHTPTYREEGVRFCPTPPPQYNPTWTTSRLIQASPLVRVGDNGNLTKEQASDVSRQMTQTLNEKIGLR